MLLILATSLLMAVGATAQTPHPLKVGDTWVFGTTNERAGFKGEQESTWRVTSVDGEIASIEVVSRNEFGTSFGRHTRDRNLNLVDAGNFAYRPALELTSESVKVGVREVSIERVEKDTGRLIRLVGEIETRPSSKLQTQAGELEVTEIVFKGKFVDPKTNQTSRFENRLFYAPAARVVVKQEFFERDTLDRRDMSRTTLDIKSFSLQPR
jgi:hypothetical protein